MDEVGGSVDSVISISENCLIDHVYKISDSDVDADGLHRIGLVNDDSQTILVTLEDAGITDQEIVTETPGGGDHQAVMDVLVTTVNGDKDETWVAESPQPGGFISQNWFTSKTDKQSLQEMGHRWRQGQWTSEENEILKRNIAQYCEEKGVTDPNSVIFDMTKDMRKDFYRVVARGLDRPLFSVYRRVLRMYDQKNHIGKYSQDEIRKLRELRMLHGNDWATIGAALGRSAGSVRDRCRLMKDSCRYGTWQHEEEMRLAAAVYELSGAAPGENVHHGLCWADVAAKVKTRTEKQCRAKWLNFLNWKQKGGTDWSSPADDLLLVEKMSALRAQDESDVDWTELAKDWSCVRSPQWLRSKWWTLKRHVPNYQTLPFTELIELVNLQIRSDSKSDQTVSEEDKAANGLTGTKYLPLRLCSGDGLKVTQTLQLPDGTHAVITEDLVDYTSFLQTSLNGNTFLIANPNDTTAFPLSSLSSSEPMIVQALPLSEIPEKEPPELEPNHELADAHSAISSSGGEEIILLGDSHSDPPSSDSSTIMLGHETVVVSSEREGLIHLSSLSDPLLNSIH